MSERMTEKKLEELVDAFTPRRVCGLCKQSDQVFYEDWRHSYWCKRCKVGTNAVAEEVDWAIKECETEIRHCWEEIERLREALEYIASGDCADPAGWADLVL